MPAPTLLPTEANLGSLRRLLLGLYVLVAACGFAALLLIVLAFLRDAPQGPFLFPVVVGGLAIVFVAHLRAQLATLAGQVQRLAAHGRRYPVESVTTRSVPKARRRSGHASPTQYVAIASWRDAKGQPQQAQSEAFAYDPAPYLAPAGLVVLADPEQPALCRLLPDGLPPLDRKPAERPVADAVALPGDALPALVRLRDALPDLFLAALFAWQGLIYLTWEPWTYQYQGSGVIDALRGRDPLDASLLIGIAAIEAAFLWFQFAFTLHAVEARQRMSWREIVPIVVCAVLVLPGGALLWPVLLGANSLAALPLAWSFWQRIQLLRQLPGKPRLERQRAAARAGGRCNILLAILVPLALWELGTLMLAAAQGGGGGPLQVQLHPWLPCLAAAVFYLLAAWDQARIGGLEFARRPAPFLGWDYIGVRSAPA